MPDLSWVGLARRWYGTGGEQRRGLVDPADVRVVGFDEPDQGALNIARLAVTDPGNAVGLVARGTDLLVEQLYVLAPVAGRVGAGVREQQDAPFFNTVSKSLRPFSVAAGIHEVSPPFTWGSLTQLLDLQPRSFEFERAGLVIPLGFGLYVGALSPDEADVTFVFREA